MLRFITWVAEQSADTALHHSTSYDLPLHSSALARHRWVDKWDRPRSPCLQQKPTTKTETKASGEALSRPLTQRALISPQTFMLSHASGISDRGSLILVGRHYFLHVFVDNIGIIPVEKVVVGREGGGVLHALVGHFESVGLLMHETSVKTESTEVLCVRLDMRSRRS